MPPPTFLYHMTPNEPLGLIFNHYDYLSTFDNDVIQQTFAEAAHEIEQEITRNPALVNQTLDDGWMYDHPLPDEPEDSYWLNIGKFGPPRPTYGDVPGIVALLATWATQYRTVETDFEIWARPGTEQQRGLGEGSLLLVF